jgi:hypothetical protein
MMVGTRLRRYIDDQPDEFPTPIVSDLQAHGPRRLGRAGARPPAALVPQGAPEELFRPIFIVGCPRSGTTLLSVILDRHSAVAVPPETHFAADVWPAAFTVPANRNRMEILSAEAVKAVLDQTPLRDLELEPAAVFLRLHGAPVTPARLLKSVLEEYAALRRKPLVAEKTPGHELYVEQLAAWFPNARFVWIVRDGRAVVQSQRRMHWIHEPVWQLCLHWRRSAIHALRFDAVHPGKIFRVQYEDLLRDPPRVLQPLHRFLDLSLEPQQLKPNGESAVIPAYENGWKKKATQPIDIARCEAWRNEVTRSELFIMSCIMGRHLRMFGYPDSSSREFGVVGQTACLMIDMALRILFLPVVYRATRATYRGLKCAWRTMRRYSFSAASIAIGCI